MLVSTILFLSTVGWSQNTLAVNSTLLKRPVLALKGGDNYCYGNYDGVKKILLADGAKKSEIFQLRLLSLAFPEGLEGSRLEFGDRKDFKQMSDVERLIYGATLARSGLDRTAEALKILDFKSSNIEVEAYRKAYFANLEFETKPVDALIAAIESFNSLPYVDFSFLPQIFFMGFRDKNPKQVLGQFLSYAEKFPVDSYERNLLMAYGEFLGEKSSDRAIAHEYIRKAYEKCKFDSETALTHYSDLIQDNKVKEAEQVLREHIALNSNGKAYASFFLSKLLLDEGKKTEAATYLNMAKMKKDELSREHQVEIEKLDRKLSGWNYYWLILIAPMAIFVILFLRSRKKI